MEEPGKHLATREGREEVYFVTFYDGCSFVPEMVAVKQRVIDSEEVAAMWTYCVVTSIPPEAGGVGGVEGVSSDDLECSGLVCA